MALPDVIVPELSGPRESLAGSTPATVKEFVLSAPAAPPPEPPPEPPPGAPPPAEIVQTA
jgi:hypothetical protein